jgi:hypothetical protein
MAFVLHDFECATCGERFESLENRPAPARVLHVACGELAERIMSAPHPKVVSVAPTPVSRGRSDPPPGPRACDTRPLADGASMHEWKAKRREVWREHRYQQVKRELG